MNTSSKVLIFGGAAAVISFLVLGFSNLAPESSTSTALGGVFLIGIALVLLSGARISYNRIRRGHPSATAQEFSTTGGVTEPRGEFETSDYMKSLASRLSAEGFAVMESSKIANYNLAFVAHQSRKELAKMGMVTRVILATNLDPVDTKSVVDYSNAVTNYILDEWGKERFTVPVTAHSFFCFPVIVSSGFNDDIKNWILRYTAPKHYVAWEFPVLISLAEKRLYYSKKTPIVGAAYYRGIRKFVEEKLAFHE